MIDQLYEQMLNERRYAERIEMQEYLRHYYAKQRDSQRQSERDLQSKQIEERDRFYANLSVRTQDLNNFGNLHPIAKALVSLRTRDNSRYSQLHHLKFHGKLHDVALNPYVKIGQLANDFQPHLQVDIRIATLLFLYTCFPDKFRDHNHQSHQSVNRVNARWISAFMGLFCAIGQRSRHQNFALYWSISQDDKDYIQESTSVEGELFRSFCPSEPALADDLVKMRELYQCLNVNDAFPNTLNPDSTLVRNFAMGKTLTFKEIIDSRFSECVTDVNCIQNGLIAFNRHWSYEPMTDSEWRAILSLYERYPIYYLVFSTLGLMMRINPSHSNDLLNCISDVAARTNHYLAKLPISELDHLVNIRSFFPRDEHITCNSLTRAFSLAGIKIEIGSDLDSSIDLATEDFPWFSSKLNLPKDQLAFSGGLRPHFRNAVDTSIADKNFGE